MGVILDSSAVIEVERDGGSIQELTERIILAIGNQEAALSAVGLTELAYGVFWTKNAGLRRMRRQYLDDLLDTFRVYPYTTDTALLAARIDAEQRQQGITIPYGDLLIGATALSLGYSVLTVNLRHFRLIPDLRVSSF